MTQNLAIVTGFGNLSEEVLALADKLGDAYTRYTIKPWLPIISDPIRVFNEFFGRSRSIIGLSPFHFDAIENELVKKRIQTVFFTGDFPWDRFLQAYLGQKIWGELDRIADEKCVAFFTNTPSNLSQPVRYFLALSNLLDSLHVRPLLACEIFPNLNAPPGFASTQRPPIETLERLPTIAVNVAREIEAQQPQRRLRFAQAVIVDNGFVIDLEASGTDDLLHRYRKRPVKHAPFLLKLPSVEFDPALDQPTIGPRTIEYCAAAGIRGIVICAETTIVASRSATIKRMNELEMFLYALPFSQLRELYRRNFPRTWAQNAAIGAQHQ